MINTPYKNIVEQFQRAFEKDLVSTCNTETHYTSITFSQNIKPNTISMLVRILEHRYHSDIFVVVKSPSTIEIWDKGVSF